MKTMPQAVDVLIGIDGGGSKTTALATDLEGRIWGRGVGGPSNYHVIGIAAAYAALDAAVRAALGDAPARPVALCLGMAGSGRPDDQAIIRAWADARYPGTPVAIVHDGQLALAAGTPEGWGVAVLCGTGSLVYGEDRAHGAARAGGWGYLLGDEGSGYAIGLAALRAVARAADGRGPQTSLTQAILQHWRLQQPQDLIAHVYAPAMQRADIAGLAEIVLAVAALDDGVARQILEDAAQELALAARAVVKQLLWAGPIPCALAGSVLVKGQFVNAAFQKAAALLQVALDPITPVSEPAWGAIRLARKLYENTRERT
ncbi:MAG TPA: BadF/BadG/BcrA/BcrD ATPase family protein [Anaerolineae bacterium]|nr:BadF/BadG/BcrA/BcrD ATPase family protein [Anaerolineae bacterium]